jgi:hypothetical protein
MRCVSKDEAIEMEIELAELAFHHGKSDTATSMVRLRAVAIRSADIPIKVSFSELTLDTPFENLLFCRIFFSREASAR